MNARTDIDTFFGRVSRLEFSNIQSSSYFSNPSFRHGQTGFRAKINLIYSLHQMRFSNFPSPSPPPAVPRLLELFLRFHDFLDDCKTASQSAITNNMREFLTDLGIINQFPSHLGLGLGCKCGVGRNVRRTRSSNHRGGVGPCQM